MIETWNDLVLAIEPARCGECLRDARLERRRRRRVRCAGPQVRRHRVRSRAVRSAAARCRRPPPTHFAHAIGQAPRRGRNVASAQAGIALTAPKSASGSGAGVLLAAARRTSSDGSTCNPSTRGGCTTNRDDALAWHSNDSRKWRKWMKSRYCSRARRSSRPSACLTCGAKPAAHHRTQAGLPRERSVPRAPRPP